MWLLNFADVLILLCNEILMTCLYSLEAYVLMILSSALKDSLIFESSFISMIVSDAFIMLHW